MDPADLDLVLGTMPQGRVPFPYYRGRYAAQMLSYLCEPARPVRELRSTPFARLLQQPRLQERLASCGDGLLRASDLLAYWPERPTWYRLSFARWGEDDDADWNQNSRARGQTLVVRVNFDGEHDRRFAELLREGGRRLFDHSGHPVETGDSLNTLAWARIDLDLDSGEALIEELQSDWTRDACDYEQWLRKHSKSWGNSYVVKTLKEHGRDATHYRRYFEEVLAPHAKVWAELTLSAALHVLVAELGIRRVWIHTPESGVRWKRIGGVAPPRSLYSQLPRRFCFRRVGAQPGFLDAARARMRKSCQRCSGPRKQTQLRKTEELRLPMQLLEL
jgi:hypothetical protein